LTKGTAWVDRNPERIERLNRRGFVAKKENQKLQVTLKGRLALWVRRHSR
jgi:Mn-dependent DtxR family transcriptional regulator